MGDSMHKREENSVRVTNLSEDTREDDLRVGPVFVAQTLVNARLHTRIPDALLPESRIASQLPSVQLLIGFVAHYDGLLSYNDLKP